ncbi:MAG TPA: tyrosine-type recombinase/integrase [Armatimonadota bacterium]|nr:tyrosine-type recombinase/integrase [Armatimonadota bacterium]
MASIKARKDKNGKNVKDKNGLNIYRIWISRGVGPDGKYILESKTYHAAKMQDAQRYAEKLEGLQKSSASLTFAEWEKEWIGKQWKKNAPRTVAGYEKMLNLRILKRFGHKRLVDIQPRDIAEFISDLSVERNRNDESRIISGHTQLKYYRLLYAIFEDAMFLEKIPFNPVAKVRAPSKDDTRAKYYEGDVLQELWAALQKQPLVWRALISTSLMLGIRRGELVGLRWGDIDWDRNILQINRSAYKIAKHPQMVGAPKTALSARSLMLPPSLKEILLAWHEQQGGDQDDYICAMHHDGWMAIDTPTQWFAKFIADNHLPKMNLHGLRHTLATTLLASGIDISTVASILGHSTPNITSRTYVHPTHAATNRALEVMPTLLSQKFSQNSENNNESPHKPAEKQTT